MRPATLAAIKTIALKEFKRRKDVANARIYRQEFKLRKFSDDKLEANQAILELEELDAAFND